MFFSKKIFYSHHLRTFALVGFVVFALGLMGCDKKRHHAEPYEEYLQVGLFGHGEGVIEELRLNYWGVARRCDSCHAVTETVHSDLGTCNSCHQPHKLGWKTSTVALLHSQSMVLAGREHHSRLECKTCHSKLTSRSDYKQAECVSCHHHSWFDVQYAHELMDEFDMSAEYKDPRCVSCHSKTGADYAEFYDPVTNELL